MEEKEVNPVLFNWIVKVGTAIITFMTGIIIWIHRKLHFMDKTLAVNEEREQQTQKAVSEIKKDIKEIKTGQRNILDKFNTYDQQYNDIVLDRNRMARMVEDQTEVMDDYKIKFIDPKKQKRNNA